MVQRRNQGKPTQERLTLVDTSMKHHRYYELQRRAGNRWLPIARFPVPDAFARARFRAQWMLDRKRLIEENRVTRLLGSRQWARRFARRRDARATAADPPTAFG